MFDARHICCQKHLKKNHIISTLPVIRTETLPVMMNEPKDQQKYQEQRKRNNTNQQICHGRSGLFSDVAPNTGFKSVVVVDSEMKQCKQDQEEEEIEDIDIDLIENGNHQQQQICHGRRSVSAVTPKIGFKSVAVGVDVDLVVDVKQQQKPPEQQEVEVET